MNLDDAVDEILRARKKVSLDQGRLARKNARGAFKAAVATALRALNREYPVIAKERVVRVSMSPLAKKRRERAKRVKTMFVSKDEALTLVTAGVKIVSSPPKGLTYKSPNGLPAVAVPIQQHFAPIWAVRALRAGVSSDEIKRGVRSRATRSRIEAFVRLRGVPMKTVSF